MMSVDTKPSRKLTVAQIEESVLGLGGDHSMDSLVREVGMAKQEGILVDPENAEKYENLTGVTANIEQFAR